MRRLILIICCLLGIFTHRLQAKEPVKAPNGKAYVGLDIADAIGSMKIDVEAGYRIKEKWTAQAKIVFNLGFAERRKSSEEIEHESMNDKMTDTGQRHEQIYEETGISLRYWLDSAYNGPYVSTGSLLDESFKPDCSLGIGYMTPVWKGLCLDLMLEKSFLTKQDNITIRLTYVF